MPILSKPSPAARWSLIYITVGALVVVWTGIWFIYLRNHQPQSLDGAKIAKRPENRPPRLSQRPDRSPGGIKGAGESPRRRRT